MKKKFISVFAAGVNLLLFTGCETINEARAPEVPLDGTQAEIAPHTRMEGDEGSTAVLLSLLSDNGHPVQSQGSFDQKGDMVVRFGGRSSSIKLIWNLMTVSSGLHRFKAVIRIRSANSGVETLEPFEFEVEDLEPRHRYAFYLVAVNGDDADLFPSIRRGDCYLKMIDRTHGLESHFNAQVWKYERGARVLKKQGHNHSSLH